MKSILVLVSCAALFGGDVPSSAGIRVRLIDPSGAPVVNAAVSVTAAGGNPVSAESAGPGIYRASVVAPGTYAVRAEAHGFAPAFREGVALAPAADLLLEIELEIAALAERVTVRAPLLEGDPPSAVGPHEDRFQVREVRESPAKDVGEALAALDGVWKIRKGGIASDVVLRGFQQGNLNVLMDGNRIYGACPNHMDPAAFHVDFSEIREVTVTKGVFNVRDQGGLGGTVNVLTKDPPSGLRIVPGFAAGSFGYFNPSINGSWSGEHFFGLAGYSYRVSDVYHDGRGNPVTSYANYRNPRDPGRAFDAGTSWTKLGIARDSQRLDFAYTRQNTNRTLYPYLLMDAGTDNADRASIGWLRAKPIGPLTQVRAQAYLTKVAHWMTDELRTSSVGAPLPYSMATFAGTRTAGGRVDAEIAGVAIGGELYRRTWTAVNTMRMNGRYSDQASIPGVVQYSGGPYADYARTFGRLRVAAGARIDFDSSDARSASLNSDLFWAYKNTRKRSWSGAAPSAMASVAYGLTPNLEWFAGGGTASRFPDPQETFFSLRRGGADWVGDPLLRTSHNREADIGFRYSNRRFTLRPTLFYSSVADYITVHNQPLVNPLPGVMNLAARSYANVDATIYGGELGYSITLTRALMLTGGASWLRGTKDVLPQSGIRASDLAEMPPLKVHNALRYGTRRWFGEFTALVSGRQDHVDTDLREQRTPGYSTFGARFGIHAGKVTFASGVENLLDRAHYEHLSYQRDPFRLGVKVPEPGRSLFLNVAYAF